MSGFKRIRIKNNAPSSAFAAEHFCIELNKRIEGIALLSDADDAEIIFDSDGTLSKDEFIIKRNESGYVFISNSVRSSVFAVGKILRKIVKDNDSISVISDISGRYKPNKSIRGHQLGYRTTPNTYDAWSYDDYERYYLDLMYFGVNTIEHIPFDDGFSSRNDLMKYDGREFLIKSCETLDRLDLDISLWHPYNTELTIETECEYRKALYSQLKKIDYLFVPGGDPGSLPPLVFAGIICKEISKALKSVHPEAKMYPSVQAPHEHYGFFGTRFLEALKNDSEGIDGLIYGPNHDISIEYLYENVKGRFPLRFYPDITHNIRCEYPVHYDRNDWHYALAACLGRECTNPRPREYYNLYKETEKYFIGSVSYSEGITDDVNKFLWSALDFDSCISPEEAVSDYVRTFFFGADTEKIVRMIFALEKNWEGNPAENDSIDECFNISRNLLREYPSLAYNWRFNQLYFRAVCDKLIKMRFVFESDLISRAENALLHDSLKDAVEILKTDYTVEYYKLRHTVDLFGKILFDQIGYQSDMEHYHADNPERGAVLDTIDLPVTDRAFLLNKASEVKNAAVFLEYFNVGKADEGEYCFSVALDNVTDEQEHEPYFNFQGDRPDKNDGTLRTALFNVFDNYTYSHRISGLTEGRDYVLRVTYLDKSDPDCKDHRIRINGNTVYCGKQFGEIDEEYTRKFCRPGFVCAKYNVPAKYIGDGDILLEFDEGIMGVMFAEYSLRLY